MLTNTLRLRKAKRLLKKVNKLAPVMAEMSDHELQNQTAVLKEKLKNGKTLDDILPEAFATVREADKRVLGKFPYDVQVIGGIILHSGAIAEMKTGEGKTLVATMPLYLNALEGKGAMLVTPNEYLASRDKKELAPVYEWLGLSVSLAFNENQKETTPKMKRKWYGSDIIYTTSSSLAFDYLFNNLASSKEDQYLRPYNYVIVDEVDDVLLDEAQTPFVVSSSPTVLSNLYKITDNFVKLLEPDKDYVLKKDDQLFWLTAQGIKKAESFFKIDKLFSSENRSLYRHIILAMNAHLTMREGHDYLVVDGEAVLLDEDTGRLKKGVQVSTGLHQAVETKENLNVTPIQKTAASVTFPSLFSLFKKVSGMSGTVKVNEEEFLQTYNLKVVEIPTRVPVIRKDYKPEYFLTTRDKLMTAIDQVVEMHKKGRPVLLVAGSVENSEIISELLLNIGIPHNVLNAYNASYEAEIIKDAGQKNAVTIATNMAGRGTDIKLGEGVEELGGLAVIGTELLPKRVELQLAGRAGRQGNPGSSQFYISLEDSFVSANSTERQKKYYRRLIRRKSKGEKITTLRSPIVKLSLWMLRNRKEVLNELMRAITNKDETVLSLQRQNFYEWRDNVMHKEDLQPNIDQIIDQALNIYLEKEDLFEKFNLQYFINQHVTYEKIDLPDKQLSISELKKFLRKLCYEQLYKKEKVLINKEQLNQFYRQVMISSMDNCWIDQVDIIDKIKINSKQWSMTGHPQELIHNQVGFKAFKKFLDKVNLATFDNLMLSKIYTDKDGQLIVLFN